MTNFKLKQVFYALPLNGGTKIRKVEIESIETVILEDKNGMRRKNNYTLSDGLKFSDNLPATYFLTQEDLITSITGGQND